MSWAGIVAGHVVIANEIAMGCRQRDVAQTYALSLQSSAPFDVKVANKAILKRWSVAGLRAIKTAAWSGSWRGMPLFNGKTLTASDHLRGKAPKK